MTAILHDSVIVVRTVPRAIPLAMITMRKTIPLFFYMGMGLCLAALWPLGLEVNNKYCN